MDLIKFIDHYKSEEACRKKFKAIRDKQGVVCKRCNGIEHYWLKGKQMYQCRDNTCRFRTSLRSGTIMECSKLPFRYWFIAIYLMGTTKKACSAYYVQRQLGHKRYEPIWQMMHKIRAAMGTRDNRYLLGSHGEVEIDEGFFETIVEKEEKSDGRKRGRGSQKQTMSIVFAQTEHVENPKKHRPSKKCSYFKMAICREFTAENAKNIIAAHVQRNAKMLTDGYPTYRALQKEFKAMRTEKISSKEAHIKLPWVHTAIGNAKKVLQGIYHHARPEYLQNYLDEFCYKLNRTYFGNKIFDRILVACTLT